MEGFGDQGGEFGGDAGHEGDVGFVGVAKIGEEGGIGPSVAQSSVSVAFRSITRLSTTAT